MGSGAGGHCGLFQSNKDSQASCQITLGNGRLSALSVPIKLQIYLL